ncbi:hypothetical protein K470DRAFT_295752 [Piedraia hortae CBS 480.64]|uniref:C2H2-type domain-containing protein n=1 Tax=Piedraia hortae CBS 480.64 TaxID=1314780 RepID=A0A6A7BVV7_9PEZI|nr:hypothetical protein K470DRAFT_295752 [Piedraia hortae CBS 480.64]
MAQPIAISRLHVPRRGSNDNGASSVPRGSAMSFGGLSFNSFALDSRMTGTSPMNLQSYQSSSYVPKMEATYMRDYRCCDVALESMFELLQHYEEFHAGQHVPGPRSAVELPLFSTDLSDFDPLDDMDMDPPPKQGFQPQPHFGRQPRGTQVNTNLINAFQGASLNTPTAPRTGAPFNPTVSSVNTPTLETRTVHASSLSRSSSDTDRPDSASLRLGEIAAQHGTITDPAKRLQGKNGSNASSASSPTANNNNDLAKRMREGPALGMPAPFTEEVKPFKCPVIGCEKSYKNQNGLKYHRSHGHQKQQLQENGDGTMSIVDPVTSMPYPGSMGMEKEKPHQCDYCGKRYKNLNGLKYHRQHNNQCNPELQMGIGLNVNVAGMM